MQPFGNHVSIKVGAIPPKHNIAQGIIQDIGTWIKGSYDLFAGDEVQFRYDVSSLKADDIIYVRLEDIFALVTTVPRPNPPPGPEPIAQAKPEAVKYPVGVRGIE